MQTVTVTRTGAAGIQVSFPRSAGDEATTEEYSEEVLDEGPSPIAPDKSEFVWGLGAFLVLFILMQLFLFPKVKQGMEARYGKIRSDHENAEATRANANQAVAEYQAALAGVRAEAAERVEAARVQLETERSALISEANNRIADKRSSAAARAEIDKAAARGSLETAVADVAARVAELSVGIAPDSASVRDAVHAVMGGGS